MSRVLRSPVEGRPMATAADSRDKYPRKFGKYHLLGPLAQGGMGALYLALSGDRGLERLMVIKTLLPHLAENEYIARFRDGAKLVNCSDDVREELGPLVEAAPDQRGGTIRVAAEVMLNEIEHAVLQAIEPTGSMLDDVAASCAMPIHRVLATVSVLESRRLVRKVAGNRVARI